MREVIIFSEDDIVNMLRGEEITLRDGSHQHTFVVENTTSLYTNAKNALDLYKDSSSIDDLLQGKKTPNQIRELAGLEPVKELDNAYYRRIVSPLANANNSSGSNIILKSIILIPPKFEIIQTIL